METRNFCSSRDSDKKMKRQPTCRGKLWRLCIWNTFFKLHRLIKKTKTKTWTKMHFTKEDTQAGVPATPESETGRYLSFAVQGVQPHGG